MKPKLFFILSLIAGAFFLSACTGSRALTATSWPGVTATEDRVYLAFGPFVYSLDAGNGSILWQYPQEADNGISFYGAPAFSDDGSQLIVGGYDNTLYSLDPETGLSSGWSFEGASNRFIGDMLTTPAGIFAANADGSLYALGFDGEPIWDEPYSTSEPMWSAPASDGSSLYVSALDHQIHAVDMESGDLVWTTDVNTASTGTPAISDGVLYAGTFGNRVLAIDTANGKTLWTFETEDWVWASPVVDGSIVYAGDISGILYALRADSGDEVWRFEADGGIYGGPLVVDGLIYFGTENGQFYALNVEGQTEWFYSLTGKIYSTPDFNGEYLFVATTEGDAILTALDLNGAARWPFSIEQ